MSEEETRKAFSTNLRFYMKRENMNQADISRLLGVSESAVGKWLNLKSTPRMGMVEKLAMHFGINKSDLLEMHAKEPLSQKSPIPETLAAHFEGKEFDENDLRDIANFVEFVAQRKKQ